MKKLQDMNWVYWTGWSWFRGVAKASFNYEVVGKERLIEEEGALIVCNHVSFLDPPLVGIAHDHGVFFLARKTLFKGFCAWLYPRWNSIPIDQENPDMTGLKKIIKALKGGKKVVIFPEGERTLTGALGPALPGVGLIIAKSQTVVQPMRIFGAREALPRGSGRLKMEQISVVVGDPIYFDKETLKQYRGKEGYQTIANIVMKAISELEDPR